MIISSIITEIIGAASGSSAPGMINTVPPSISGGHNVGDTLTCSPGTWVGASGVTYAYQWERDGVAIGGQTAATHVIVTADVGTALTCVVTASGSVPVESSAVADAAYVPPVNTVAPAITGSAAVGSLLTCSNGTWTGTASISFTKAWRKNGVPNGSTGNTYTTVIGDIGADIDCVVTADNGAPGTVNATSNSVSVLSNRTQWTNGDGDNDWTNSIDWDNSVPDASLIAVFDDDVSSDDCTVPDTASDVLGIDASNFSGALVNAATLQDAYFNVYGNVALGPDINTPRKIQLVIMDDVVLTSNGFPKVAIASTATGKNLTLADNVSLRLIDTANLNVDWDNNTMTFSDAAGSNGTCSILGGTSDWSMGAKIIVTTSTTMVMALTDAPPIELKAGAGTTQIDDVYCEAFLQEAGTLTSTGAGLLGTSGNFAATGGTAITGTLSLDIGGNFSNAGVPMTGVTADVTGTATASGCTVTNCNFTAGTNLTATDCPNGTGNSGVTFVETASPVVLTDPTISGSTPIGSTLTATPGTASGINKIRTGQWYKAGVAIGGQTASTYVTVSGDATTAITYKDIWTNSHGATTSSASNSITVSVAAAAGNPWTGRTGGDPGTNLFSVCHNGAGTLVAVGGYNAGLEVMYSTDHGVTWTSVAESIAANYWSAVCWSGSNFVAVSSTGKCMTSPTGLAGTWTTRTLANGNQMRGIASDGAGVVVAVATDGPASVRVQYSADHGVTWADKNPGVTSTWITVAYGGGYFIMGSDAGILRNSTDGQSWSACTAASGSPTVYGLAYDGIGTWVLCGHSGASLQVAHSTDNGATWTAHSVPTDKPWNGVCWGATAGGGMFVIVGTGGTATSPTGVTWTNHTPVGGSQEWRSVTHDGTNFVAVSYDTTAVDVMTAP